MLMAMLGRADESGVWVRQESELQARQQKPATAQHREVTTVLCDASRLRALLLSFLFSQQQNGIWRYCYPDGGEDGCSCLGESEAGWLWEEEKTGGKNLVNGGEALRCLAVQRVKQKSDSGPEAPLSAVPLPVFSGR